MPQKRTVKMAAKKGKIAPTKIKKAVKKVAKERKEVNSKMRRTKGGTQVILENKIGVGVYTCKAMTRTGGAFLCQVAEEDLL